MTEDGYISPAMTRVLLALMKVYERDGRATVRSVAAEVGLNVSTVHSHLLKLRRLEVVRWDPSVHGTLRPAVKQVA